MGASRSFLEPERMKLLVIDPARAFLEAVKNCAADAGCRSVITAGNAEEGLRAASAMRPEIVLADLDLRTAEGKSVIHALRPLLPGAVLVCLSLDDEGEMSRARWRTIADICVEKPRLAETLPALLEAAAL